MASITLSKKIEIQEDGRFRLKAWVSNTSDNIPSQIFVYERLLKIPKQLSPLNAYKEVCSYADILNYPADTPHTYSPFFRLYYIDQVYTSFNELNTFWEAVLTAVEVLINDIVDTNTADAVHIQHTYS